MYISKHTKTWWFLSYESSDEHKNERERILSESGYVFRSIYIP